MSSLKRSLRRALGVSETPEGYVPIGQFEPDDVFIVGYPKSGNTWFQELICATVYGMDPRLTPMLLASDVVPDVHFNQFYRRYAKQMYFKSHALPMPEYRRVIYLMRDGRDAMVSYYHYLKAIHKRDIDFGEFVKTGLSLIECKWHEHVEAWEKNPYKAELITIKYEDLLSEPVREMERFCAFAKVERFRADLEKAVDLCVFKNLRAKEDKMGPAVPSQWPSDKKFFRRGVAGSYKDEMPPAVLEQFMSDASPTLARYHYAVA
jgi:hypothetical protein